jgi:hypothetical protein
MKPPEQRGLLRLVGQRRGERGARAAASSRASSSTKRSTAESASTSSVSGAARLRSSRTASVPRVITASRVSPDASPHAALEKAWVGVMPRAS